MVNIFYNKKNLKDSMIISLNRKSINDIEKHESYTLLKNNGELVGINIFDVSKHDNSIKEGYLMLNSKLNDFIKKITNVDLSNYYETQFVVGKVIECEPIPNTHLHLCKVDTKKQILQIVCGASNVAKDLYVVVALENTCMPNGMLIVKNKLQGYESCGMLCSKKELFNNPKIESQGILLVNDKTNPWGSEYKDHFANNI